MTEVVVEQTPPILQGPSDKEKKYDRQLRLWAANGQAALEEAHILLLNSGSGAAGVETLKNLVLPGIGMFTIADDAIVDEADLGVNFFLDEKCLGRLRSECCTKLLQELNPDVKGAFMRTKNLFQDETIYTFILCVHPLPEQLLENAQKYSHEHKVPLVHMNSAGFYSYFQIQLPGSFPIVHTHPESSATTDLRLLSPWPELSAFVKEMTTGIDKLDAHTHGHIPYLVLLLYYLEEWKKSHGGNAPLKYADKLAFRKMVADGTRTDNPEFGEENYEEAVAAVVKNITAPALSSSVREVFEYTPSEAEAESSFWIITDAVKKFYAKHKELPLPGSVPDMKAQSEVYIRLQNIYKAKARQDVAEVFRIVRAHPRGQQIDVEEVAAYCKNCAFIKLINSTGLVPRNLSVLTDAELNAEFALSPTLIPIYLAMKASEKINNLTAENVLFEISRISNSAGQDDRVAKVAQEVARAKGGELHNISALTGGMVAQEIIKIVTKQYVPIDNTCIFDGIASRIQILKI